MRHFPLIASAAVFVAFILASLTMSVVNPGGRPFGMEWVSLLLLVAAAVIAPLLAFEAIDNARHRKRAVRTLSSRPQLSAEQFGETFFAENDRRAAIAAQVRAELEQFFPLPLGGLLPDDRFEGVDMDIDDPHLFWNLDARFGIDVSPDWPTRRGLKTVRSLVDYVEERICDQASRGFAESR